MKDEKTYHFKRQARILLQEALAPLYKDGPEPMDKLAMIAMVGDAFQKALIMNLVVHQTIGISGGKIDLREAKEIPAIPLIRAIFDKEFSMFFPSPYQHLDDLEEIGWLKLLDGTPQIITVQLTKKAIEKLSSCYVQLAGETPKDYGNKN